jgi:hypothetical protein
MSGRINHVERQPLDLQLVAAGWFPQSFKASAKFAVVANVRSTPLDPRWSDLLTELCQSRHSDVRRRITVSREDLAAVLAKQW